MDKVECKLLARGDRVRMLAKTETNPIVKTLYRSFKDIFRDNLEEVIIFGSCARNEQEEGSDIDVMVLVSVGRDNLKAFNKRVVQMTSDFSLRHDVLISSIVQNKDFFYEWVEDLPFYRNVNAEGVRINA
jgi:predicted nucleotidyltransferase